MILATHCIHNKESGRVHWGFIFHPNKNAASIGRNPTIGLFWNISPGCSCQVEVHLWMASEFVLHEHTFCWFKCILLLLWLLWLTYSQYTTRRVNMAATETLLYGTTPLYILYNTGIHMSWPIYTMLQSKNSY